ncbi:MAG: hypothetical protein A49_27330 [Methyloceanibacter sp.]|nr:MAG: hypothetical protein A49_27330 [Methyloceanibacter sp.]
MAASVHDAVMLGEGKAARHGAARHLHGGQAGPEHSVAQILDAGNSEAGPAIAAAGPLIVWPSDPFVTEFRRSIE